jgi:hypothetical protein
VSESNISIDVKTKTIQTLIKEVGNGDYYLPSFQRQYVWDEDDIESLVESVIDNHPIGNIILWKPSIKSSRIDPFSKPLIGKDLRKKMSEVNYIIDGQQRLTSLLLMFNNWKITRAEEIIHKDPISYNLSKNAFNKGIARGIDLSLLIRAFCLQDLDALNDLTKRIPKAKLDDVKDKIRKILDYPIPMYVMSTSREDEKTFLSMAEAFIKINKNGVRIGNLELMLSFLAGAISGNLKQSISNMYDEMYLNFALDLQPVIRFVFSRFDLRQTQISKPEQFRSNIDKIGKHNNSEQVNIFGQSERSLKLTLELLNSNLGIKTSSILPSQTVLVPMASYFFNQNAKKLSEFESKDLRRIINWFILASFQGYYSSRTDTKLDEDLDTIAESDDEFPYTELIQNMEDRGTYKISKSDLEDGQTQNVLRTAGRAYLFLEYVLLVRNDADDWTGERVKQRNLEDLARHHIFPEDYLEENLTIEDQDTSEVQISNLGNITWINKNENEGIGATPPNEYLSKYADSISAHMIPIEKKLWEIERYERFVRKRFDIMFDSLVKHFPSITQS